jgi:hypothetical protein
MRLVVGWVVLCVLLQDNKSPFSKEYKGQPNNDAGTPSKPVESAKKPEKTKAAAKAALDFLARTQRPDGSWACKVGVNTGILVTTSFGGLAMLAGGEAYRPHADKAAHFVMAHMFDKSGNRDPKWDQTNWQIGVGGVFLGEYYGVTKSGDAKSAVEHAVAEMFQRIEPSGGWGHCPRIKNSLGYVELEIMSTWMLITAGIAKRAKSKVPEDKLKSAMQWVEDCCSPGKGNVGYSPGPGQKGYGCPGRAGGAMVAWALLGMTQSPFYPKLVAYYKSDIDRSSEAHASLAMGMLGSAIGARQIGPEMWDVYVEKFFPMILEHANGDGSFKHLTGKTPASMGGDNNNGPAYNTAIYALILNLDLGHLAYLGRQIE